MDFLEDEKVEELESELKSMERLFFKCGKNNVKTIYLH